MHRVLRRGLSPKGTVPLRSSFATGRGRRGCEFGLVCVVAVHGMAGCAGPLNEEIGLRGAPLPALGDAPAATELDGTPSLSGSFDRRAWPPVVIDVPAHQVANQPQFTGYFRWRRERAPWDGAFPGPLTALVDETDAGADLADGATDILITAGTIVGVPVAAAAVGPWAVGRSPVLAYERVPPG